MMVTVEEALARFFKIGAVLALLGALHMLTLLLPWYVVSPDTLVQVYINGYNVLETLALSVVGGVLAGVGLFISSFMSRVSRVRLVLTSLAIAGGALAALSPTYLLMVKIPRLQVAGNIEWGLFASLFTALALLAVGILAALTRLSEPRYTYSFTGTTASTMPQLEETSGGETTFEPAESVDEGAMCTICYQDVSADDAVKCASCGMVYHRGCIDEWVSLNGNCPNCKSVVKS